ncbi:LPXTG cell wall anchor domain-containing protein [Streptomyces sp. NPDC001002]
MSNRRYRPGAVLAVLAASVAAWLPVSSAQAADADSPVVRIHVQDDNLGLPLPPTDDPPQVNWGLDNDGPGTAKDVTIKADLSDVIDWVTPDATVPADHIYTWPTRDVPEGQAAGSLIGLSAKPGTPLGTTGTVTLSGTSANGTVVPVTVKVTVGTNDLTVNRLKTRKGDKPGSTIDEPITISNVGTLPSDGVQLRMRTTIGLGYAEHFSNCVYSKESPDPYGLTEQALCTFDTVVEPGKSYRLDQPVGLDVTEQALFDYFSHEALPLSGPGTGAARSGSGPVLSLVPAGAAATDGVDIDRQHIDADNTADMVADGDSVEGERGDLVHVTVSLTNEGPGWVGYNASDDQPALMFTVPTGTRAVEIPEHCSVWNIDGPSGEQTPGAPKYICQSSPNQFTVGDSRTFEFGLRIHEDAVTTSGEAKATTVYGSTMTFDHTPANDTSAVTVEVEGTDSSATPSPSASATSGTGGNDPGTQTVSSSDGTGSLASTGSSNTVRVAAAWGAGALLLGGGLVVLARRRKS